MLCYVDDALPGFTRRRRGRYWQYFDAKGERITDRDEIDRLNGVGLPPAYKDAWFCPSPEGHIQAIGYDDRGRKQYRYHPEFRASQEAAKYDGCVDFGRALPLLRARVEEDMVGRKLDRDTVVAAIVRLLDLGHIRIGNESYAKENKSFGATTLRDRHAKVKGGRSEEHTSELQSLMRNSYAVFCLKKKKINNKNLDSTRQNTQTNVYCTKTIM